MDRQERVFLFAGPTLYRTSVAPLPVPASITLLPPVGRGDIERLLDNEPYPGSLIIVDGVFHERLAVSHAEIREALGAGWGVWGIASMGAIRAREMRDLGMRGFGKVYQLFESEADFQDDEVALLHGVDAPYLFASEPLVHIRHALGQWNRQGWLTEETTAEIIERLKARWFGERTLTLLGSELETRLSAEHHARIRTELAAFARYRIKTEDLEVFLRQRYPHNVQSSDVPILF